MTQPLPETRPVRYSLRLVAFATSHKPQATSHKPQATSHKPQATSHKPQATSHKPQAGLRPRPPRLPSRTTHSCLISQKLPSRYLLFPLFHVHREISGSRLIDKILAFPFHENVAEADINPKKGDVPPMPQSLPRTQPRCYSLARRPADPSDRFVSPIARRLRRGLFSALLCLPLLAMFATGVQAQTSTISLSLASSSGNEGNSGHSDVDVTISVSPRPSATSVFDFCVKNTGTATFRTRSGGKARDFDIVSHSGGAPLEQMTAQNCRNFTFLSSGGSTNQRVKLRIFGDTTPEENETVILELRNPHNVVVSPTAGTATYTINNDDVTTSTTPTVTIAGGSAVTEGTGAQFTVNASPAPTGALTVQLDVSDDDTSDFVAAGDEGRKTVTIGASQTSATYTVNTVADSTDEPNGEVTVSVAESDSYTVGSTSSATTMVNDDDADTTAPQVSSITRQTPSTESTDANSLTWRVTFDEPVQNVDAADFQVSGTTASITGVSPVSSTNAYDVTASGGDLENLNARVTLRFASNHNIQDTSGNALATNPTPTGTNHNSFTVSNTIVSPTITIRGGSAVTEGTRAQFTVSASPVPTGNLIVNLSITQNGDVMAGQPGSRTVTIDTSGSATHYVHTQDDSVDEANGSVTVTVNARTGYTVGSPSSATITVNDNDTRGLVLNPASLSVGEGNSANYTVKLATRPTATVTVTVGGTGSSITVDTDSGSPGDQTTLTFNPANSPLWSTAQTVTVSAALDSNTVNESVTLTHTTSGGDYGANSVSKNLTVTATDKPAAASFASGSSSAAENAGTHNVTVNLSPAAPSGGLTLRYSVTGTATAGSGNDFTIQNSGTLSVTAGATSANIPVVILDDNTDEPAETVILTLTGDTGYTLGSTTVHTLTITDNDDPVASFASASSSAAENAGTHNVTVNLTSAAPSGGLTLSYNVTGTATVGSGNDFTIQGSGSLSVAAGATSATIPVAINDDSSNENAETVILTLTGGTGYTLGSPTVHTLTITDNDGTGQPAVSFASASSSAAENAGTRNVRVNLSAAAPSGGLTLGYSVTGTATAGSSNDFTIQNSGTVSVSAGATSATIPVAINDDGATESAETVILTLTDGTGYTLGSPSVHTLTITDNDSTAAQTSVSFASASSSVAEDAGTRNVRVNLSAAAPSGGLTLGYNVTGTATAGSGNDFTIQGSGSLTIAAGATSATIPVAINDDGATESAETVILTLTDGTGYTLGSPTVHTLTITDNDGTGPPPTTPVASFASASSSVAENVGTHTVTVNISPAPLGGLSLGYNVSGTATASSDFTISNSGTVTVSAGATSATIPVAINDDSTEENAETVILTLTRGTGYTLGSPTVHTLTITDNDGPGTTDPPGPRNGNDDEDENEQDGEDQDPTPGTPVVAFAADTSRPREDAGTSDVPVTFAPAPAAALTVHYTVTGTATTGRDFTALTGAVTVSAGATRVTIPVGLTDDRLDEGAETVILTLTEGEGYTLGTTQVHTLTITDNDTAGLRMSPTTVHLAEAGEQATVSVHLTAQPTAPVTVTFASSQGRVATVTPATLRFTPATWQTPQTVTITAGADGVSTLRGTVQSTDRGYAALASGALPPIRVRVRVGADLTGLTTPWLARFGRTVTSQAVTGVTARLAAARTPGLTGTVAGLALDRMGEAADPATTQVAPATQLALAPADPRLNPGGQQLNLRDILAGSAFALTSDPSATGGSYALWGQGAWTHFAGQAGAQDVEGNVLSGTLGVDWAQGAWVLGVAVSHTQGDGDAAQTTAQGDLASSLTLVTPYVGVDVTEQLSLWGTMGYGRGTVGLTLPTEPEVETDTSLLLAAGGLRGRLLEPAPTGGLAVAVRSEARFLRTSTEAAEAHGLAEIEADVVLFRVGLESSWQQPLADGGSVVPRLNLGLRQDAGDAERGFGFEVRGGVRWEAPAQGLTLDLAGQTLLAHSDQEFETWGGSATVQWAANPNSAAGPALTLRQTYGGAGTGGGAGSVANTFWTEDPVALLQAPGPAELRLTVDFGWGVPLQAGLGVPHVQYGWGPTSRDVTLGWRLLPTRATDMTLELTATYREAVRTAPVQGVALSLTLTW